MDANWVSRKLILAAALFLSSSASVLNITTPEVEVGKTTNVSLGCFNPYPARDISEIAIIRILKWDHDEWNSVAELQRGDGTAVRQKSKDVFVKGNIGSVAESFLRLTWPVATNDTLGQYRCDFISLTFQENVLWQKSLSVFITSTNLTVHVLSEIVEQNKREGFQLLHLQKHDLVENMTATVEDLEADLESQLKYHIRTLSHTVEGNKNESDNQKREILWKMKSSVEKNKKEFLRLLRSQEKDVQENLKTTMEALEAGFQSQIQALSRTMKDNKNECDDQKQKVLEKMTTTVEGIESCFEDKMKSQIKVLTDTVEENKKECPRQLDLHKRQILENVTETVVALEAGLESKMKEQIQVLNHTFEEKRKKDLQQNQIMEKMKAALEESKRECLQQKQDILDNVTATMEALEAGFERKLDDVKSQLQVHMCSDSRGLGPRPVVRLLNGMKVVCDTETDNGGWIVIQRRASADVDFFRGWEDYKNGFGDLSGNFWFGLEKVHQLTRQGRFELRFDFTYQGYDYYATYDTFVLSGESENYKFWTSGFDGNVWNVMAFNNGASFSTKDRDNDGSDISCAYYQHGGWWFDACSRVNLNGRWASKEDWKGMRWSSVTGNAASVSFSEMKIRPLDK